MNFADRLQQDLTSAMRARDELRTSTLRLVKAALKNREIEQQRPLAEQETLQVLATLVKQRREAIEQFVRGGRQDLADKEAAEIALIEAYLPRAADQAEIETAVLSAIAELGASTQKDIGPVMKLALAKLQAAGVRADGKLVNELARRALADRT